MNILANLKTIFKASATISVNTKKTWRDVRVAFIPKAERRPPEEAKSYRPISCTSFLLNTREKIVHDYIGERVLNEISLHGNQFAYQTDKSRHYIVQSKTLKRRLW